MHVNTCSSRSNALKCATAAAAAAAFEACVLGAVKRDTFDDCVDVLVRFQPLLSQNEMQTTRERCKSHAVTRFRVGNWDQTVTVSFLISCSFIFGLPTSVHFLHFSIPYFLSFLPPLLLIPFQHCPSLQLSFLFTLLFFSSSFFFFFTVFLSLLQLLSSTTADQHQPQRGYLRHLHS